jgi:uncharacterized membrane protein (DUF373 family)
MSGQAVPIHGSEEADIRRLHLPHTSVNQFSRRFLEVAQDFIVVALIIVLFALMVRTLGSLTREVFVEDELRFRSVIAEVLFMLLMVELVRLLLVYLREHHVAVDFMVELGIVSTLREVVLHGVVDLNWEQIAALSLFLIALGILLRFGDVRRRGAEFEDAAPLRDDALTPNESARAATHAVPGP